MEGFGRKILYPSNLRACLRSAAHFHTLRSSLDALQSCISKKLLATGIRPFVNRIIALPNLSPTFAVKCQGAEYAGRDSTPKNTALELRLWPLLIGHSDFRIECGRLVVRFNSLLYQDFGVRIV